MKDDGKHLKFSSNAILPWSLIGHKWIMEIVSSSTGGSQIANVWFDERINHVHVNRWLIILSLALKHSFIL